VDWQRHDVAVSLPLMLVARPGGWAAGAAGLASQRRRSLLCSCVRSCCTRFCVMREPRRWRRRDADLDASWLAWEITYRRCAGRPRGWDAEVGWPHRPPHPL